MIKNYLKVTLRNLMKNKVFFFINVFGLGIALACAITAYLNYDYNQNFDVEHVNADEIYRINIERDYNDRITKYGLTPIPLGGLLKENAPEPEKIVRMSMNNGNIKIEDDLFSANITYVDEGFFDMFTFPLISGSYDIADRSKIYIHEDLAIQYFGEEDPIGQQITQVLDSTVKDYIVGGVFSKKPHNSSFMFIRAFTHYDNYFDTYPDLKEDDWSRWNLTFVQLNDKAALQSFESQLFPYIEPQNKARDDFKVTKYYLDPLVGMAKRTEKEDVGSWLREGLPSAAEIAPLIMAILLLLLACFNFTNTSIAISGKRLKEIGLRKVMGGVRSQLTFQFLMENLLLCLIALIVGLVLAEFLVPAYSRMWDFLEIEINYLENIALFGFVVVLLIFTGVIAGSYPAFYVSKFEPTSILKRTEKFGGASILSKILLVLQFSIAILAIISAVAFIQNARYQEKFDLGFEGEGVLYAQFNNKNDYNVYKNAVVNNPVFNSYSGSSHQMLGYRINDPVKFEEKEIETNILEVDENYLETMQIELLEGRNFEKDSESDRQNSALVSKLFVKEMGWDTALGKRIVWRDTVQLYVVGLIEDIYVNSLWAPLEPMMLRLADEEEYRYLTLQTDPHQVQEANDFMEATWKEIFPNKLYNGQYFNEAYTEASIVNRNIVKMFLFLGIIAAILAVSGLYTLISLNILKRMKEIAVRKVLGATIGHVAYKINIPFIIILLIACIIGSALSYIMVDALFASIWTYHMQLNVFVFLISAIVMVIIAILTVGYKVFRAANANPANTLRNE